MFKKLANKITQEAKSRYSVCISADSENPNGERITTFILRYPRFITPEFLTHRNCSRNSSSSRAIPFTKLAKQVLKEPMMPVSWGQNNPGMQSKSDLSAFKVVIAYLLWRLAGLLSVAVAYLMYKLGAHKQITNRITEFSQAVNVIATATNWDNFFALRCHPDAQPEMKYLADLMYDALQQSTPEKLNYGEWHLPLVHVHERKNLSDLEQIKVSVARCARVSYRTHDNQLSKIEDDLKLYNRLVTSGHFSPTEHQAKAVRSLNQEHKSNFSGNWLQYRKTIPNECIKNFTKDNK